MPFSDVQRHIYSDSSETGLIGTDLAELRMIKAELGPSRPTAPKGQAEHFLLEGIPRSKRLDDKITRHGMRKEPRTRHAYSSLAVAVRSSDCRMNKLYLKEVKSLRP